MAKRITYQLFQGEEGEKRLKHCCSVITRATERCVIRSSWSSDAPHFHTSECWNDTWLWHQAASFNMLMQARMPLSTHCVLFYAVWVGLALSGCMHLCFFRSSWKAGGTCFQFHDRLSLIRNDCSITCRLTHRKL